MPEVLIRGFSKRTSQIDAELDRLTADGGDRTPRLVKWTVHATRKPKEHEAPDTLYGRWRAEAAERGHDPDTLVRAVTGRTPDRQHDRTVSAAAADHVFDRLAGPEGLTATASTFTRPDVLVALGVGLTGVKRTELEALADRFLAERAISVVADRALEERRWSTAELLAVEQQLVHAATGRASEHTAVLSHDAVRAALAVHPTAGEDQRAMVRDVCQGGAGVALVVGRAGTGKTFALGMARHAWQLDGYRPLATASTGIATVSLESEGYEEVATCDRLLVDLDHGRETLSDRTVLVVDEAGMLGSRKLTRLLDHAEQAKAKVVLVGDDRQLASIDAGGGFRALRLRLGASELTENRRQHQAWEREALELVRSGLVEEAVAAYRAHDRVVAADSKPAATLALLQDWWAAWQEAEQDPAQDVIVLAGRRTEVDRLNSACQQLLAARGRLGPDRLQVEELKLAVGDRVVCGRNAIAQLAVANGTRGTITALDPQARTLTLRLDAKDGHEVTLPCWYLDGRQWSERNRRVDLAYATTGHRAQGLTRWRALVRITGREDANWLYVQLSRARHKTTLYPVVGPEPQGPAELDLPDREAPDGYDQLAQALSHAGDQTLAIDTPSSLDLRQLSTRELRSERDRLRHRLDQAPRDRSRELQRASARRAEADQALEQLTTSSDPQRHGRGMLRQRRRGESASADRAAALVARQQADRAHDAELTLRRQQQRRAGWLEANAHLGPAYRQVLRELAWQRRARGLAAEHEPPAYLRQELGPVPESTRGRRAWRQAAATIEDYCRSHQVTDPDRALGGVPHDLGQRTAWQHARQAIARVQGRQAIARVQGRQRRPNRDRQPQRDAASRPSPVDRHQQDQPPPRSRDAQPRRSGRNGPPASTTRRPAMARQPHSHPDGFWSSCDDEQPGVSIRPLSQADLTGLLAHLHHDQDQDDIPGSGGSAPVVAVRVRASVGRPGASAQAQYRRRRATELATWARSLPWRVAAVAAAGVAAWLAAARAAPNLAAPAGITVAAGLGWRLHFHSSRDTLAWRRGAAGERRTARLLAPLERKGWAVLHDLAIANSPANIDHLVIGPGGVVVIDSKQYRGRLRVDRDGMVWHGRHLLVSALRTTLWEADQADEVLGIADLQVAAIVAVHGTSVPWGALRAEGVTLVPARRLPDLLGALPPVLGPERVARLTDQARVRFRAA